MNRKKFEKDKATKATQPLHLVHPYLIGTFHTKYLGGEYYVLTFIENFNRMEFGYLLENKDQNFDRFKYFKALVEN